MNKHERHKALHHFSNHAQRNSHLSDAVPAQTVIVEDGSGHTTTYSSITAALKSITNASPGNEYLVTIGPGTYNEQLTLVPYVYIKGSGPGTTIITSPAPVVTAVDNSSLSWCTIQTIPTDNPETMAVVVPGGVLNVSIGSCTISATGSGSIVGVEVANASCAMNNCAVSVSGNGGDATAVRVEGGGLLEMSQSKLTATGSGQLQGGFSLDESALNLNWCSISATTAALFCDNTGATLVARDCNISGPIIGPVELINE